MTTSQQPFTLDTTRFGPIQVSPEQIITFVSPILGFENDRRFALLEHAEDSPFQWLQSIDTPALAFVVTQPGHFGLDYTFELPQAYADQLEAESPDEVAVFTLVTIPSDGEDDPSRITTNLLAPIVLNHSRRIAVQSVLAGTSFQTKTPLLAPLPPASTGEDA